MLNISREKMKEEAISRLKSIKFDPTSLAAFEQDGTVVVSKENSRIVALTQEEKEMVAEAEKKMGILIYHVLSNNMGMFGHHYSFLYVSNYVEDWNIERSSLRDSIPIAYVRNYENEFMSDFGSIHIKVQNGVLMRLF